VEIFEMISGFSDSLIIDEQSTEKQIRLKVENDATSCEIDLGLADLKSMGEAINLYLINHYGRQQASDYQSRILDACKKLRVDRAKEYNNGVSVDTYMAFGTKSYFTFIWTKILRLKSMISNPNNRYEGLLDSIYDGINYLLFFGAWILQQLDQGKEGDSVDICTILDESDPATRDFVAKYLESIKGAK
jgi:hypothetical protein